MEQRIRYCTTSDGVTVAYASVGEGPPVVYATGWPTHLEMEWETPSSRSFLEDLAQGCTTIRYDMRGTGLSDRDVADFSLDALTKDLEAVVDHAKLERFALVSLGVLAGPVAMTFAAAHPERVTRLVLSTPFVRGSELTTQERQRAMIDYADEFGLPLFEFLDQPDADLAAQRDAQRRQQAAAPRKVQAALLRTLFAIDVGGVLDRLTMPTLVFHGRTDRIVPFALGREIASRLPQAEFVPIKGMTTAAWAQSDVLVPEIRRFLELKSAARATPAAPASGALTILFTDVAGSTALTQRLGDARARDVLREHERITREALKTHGGTEVKTMGDGFMASFSSAAKALECAIAMQKAFADYNAQVGAQHAAPLHIRIGLNAGEPIAEERDLFGTTVQLAARICAQAEPGQILASNVVRELVAGKGFLFSDRGETALRGFEDPVRLYEVRWRESAEAE